MQRIEDAAVQRRLSFANISRSDGGPYGCTGQYAGELMAARGRDALSMCVMCSYRRALLLFIIRSLGNTETSKAVAGQSASSDGAAEEKLTRLGTKLEMLFVGQLGWRGWIDLNKSSAK